MKKIPTRIALIVFWLLVLTDLLAVLADLYLLHAIIKSLLIPALALLLTQTGVATPSTRSVAPLLVKKQPIYILLILFYGTGLMRLLFPYLGPLKIPFIFYSAVICSMLLCSIHIYLKVPAPANRHFVTGAILFVLSDAVLAINKFFQPLPLPVFG